MTDKLDEAIASLREMLGDRCGDIVQKVVDDARREDMKDYRKIRYEHQKPQKIESAFNEICEVCAEAQAESLCPRCKRYICHAHATPADKHPDARCQRCFQLDVYPGRRDSTVVAKEKREKYDAGKTLH